MNQMELSEETLLTALQTWDLSPPLTVRHLAGGFTSDIWRVETASLPNIPSSHKKLLKWVSVQPEWSSRRAFQAERLFQPGVVRSLSWLRARMGSISLLRFCGTFLVIRSSFLIQWVLRVSQESRLAPAAQLQSMSVAGVQRAQRLWRRSRVSGRQPEWALFEMRSVQPFVLIDV